MSQHTFKRGRGPMRFKPTRGLSTPKPARAGDAPTVLIEAKPGQLEDLAPEEKPFDRRRREAEVRRAENLAAGLPEDAPEGTEEVQAAGRDQRYRSPVYSQTEDEGDDESTGTSPSTPSRVPKGFIERAKQTVANAVRKVTKLIKPEEKSTIEVIINAEPLETRVCVLVDSRLDDFTVERTNAERLVGSVYKGKVRNLEDGLKAAFVDIGFEKNAFLHYWDIIPSTFDSSVELVEREDRKKKGKDKPKITTKDVPKLYPVGSEIIVQVTKGPIGTKGPRITTNLSLPGRYLVLLPNSEQCGISRKIEDPAERQRLKKILRELTLPEGMGVIIRTAGEGKLKRYFIRDLALLLEEWKAVQDKIKEGRAPSCVFQEPDLIERTVRDFLTEDVTRIIIDDNRQFQRVKELIGKVSQRSAKKIAFYNEAEPLFDRYNISRQLEQAFGRQVTLKSGGYLIIDETEALVAIDVNTGRHKGTRDHDQNLLKVNLEAADEICRQLRLRNMGGIIVLDFIDMKSRKDQQQVYQRMRQHLKRDRAKTHVLPLSQLGLMEMTRQRHTESIAAAMYVDCPHCRGRGVVKSPESLSVEIQRKLMAIMKARPRDDSDFQIRIHTHPSVLERMRSQDERLLIELEKRFYAKLTFRPETGFHTEQWRIVNAMTNDELGKGDI